MIKFPCDPKDLIGKKLIWRQPGSHVENNVYLITSYIKETSSSNYVEFFYADNLTRKDSHVMIQISRISAEIWEEIIPLKPPIVYVNRLELITNE